MYLIFTLRKQFLDTSTFFLVLKICSFCQEMYHVIGEVPVQAFLDFLVFDFRGFQFTAIYNSILFSSPLALLSNLDLRGFCFRGFSFGSPD